MNKVLALYFFSEKKFIGVILKIQIDYRSCNSIVTQVLILITNYKLNYIKTNDCCNFDLYFNLNQLKKRNTPKRGQNISGYKFER